INPFKTSREEKNVPNTVRASARTKRITVSQPPVFTKKDKQKANVSIKEKQKKHQPKVKKSKKVGFIERLATPKPSKPRFLLRWSPTGRLFDLKGKIIEFSKSESQSDCSNGDNAYTSNTLEPKIKRFPNSTSLLGRNDHVAAILGFGDLQWGNILITRVYFVKGDSSTNLYIINLHEMASASPICLVARASSTKSWLWHQRLSHLNFDTINDLARNDLVSGLLKFKYLKEHLCPSYDYSCYTWVHFLRSKDEAPEVIKTFLKRITVLLQSPVIIIRTKNGTEFKKQVLKEYFDYVGISHQMSSVRTPQQNRVVERSNRTLVEAARTMLIFSRTPLFLWAEAIATAALCYPKNDREDIGKLDAKGLDLTYAPSTITTQQPTKGELDLLFEAMYDDYIGGQPSPTTRTVSAAQEPQVRQTSTASTSIADTAPTLTNSSSHATNFPNTSQDVDELNSQQQHA
nr:hypothetical protein [Tanacetum cinerariifolium]